MKATSDCHSIDQVVISTDDNRISQIVEDLNLPKCSIHHRSEENAQDASSTESVMLEYLQSASLAADDTFILIQATSPFTKSNHLTEALNRFMNLKVDSLLSVVKTKRFFWNEDGTPQNYDYKSRPRRQDFDGKLMENGAFYINSVSNILSTKSRLSGKIALYEMPEYTLLSLISYLLSHYFPGHFRCFPKAGPSLSF